MQGELNFPSRQGSTSVPHDALSADLGTIAT